VITAPRDEGILNRRIKHREIFRPFAPSILAKKRSTGAWFEKSHPSPFMTMAYSVRREKRERFLRSTHVDGTGTFADGDEDGESAILKLIRKWSGRRRAGRAEHFV